MDFYLQLADVVTKGNNNNVKPGLPRTFAEDGKNSDVACGLVPHTYELAQKVGLATEHFNGHHKKKSKKIEDLRGFSPAHGKLLTF